MHYRWAAVDLAPANTALHAGAASKYARLRALLEQVALPACSATLLHSVAPWPVFSSTVPTALNGETAALLSTSLKER